MKSTNIHENRKKHKCYKIGKEDKEQVLRLQEIERPKYFYEIAE